MSRELDDIYGEMPRGLLMGALGLDGDYQMAHDAEQTTCPMCGGELDVDALCPHEDPMCWRDCQTHHVNQGRWNAA